MIFDDRSHAGRALAQLLGGYADRDDVLVLALPRGGVPVAFEVAQSLGVPLDVYVVRKLGVPQQPELALGAIASGGVRVLNDDIVGSLELTNDVIEAISANEERELTRQEEMYRGGDRPLVVEGKTAILIDDGLATGATMRAAILALRKRQPARIVVAVPVAAGGTCESLEGMADEVVCVQTPEPFFAVGAWYRDFSQISDDTVRELLAHSRRGMHGSAGPIST
jgi:putative phosphoribosyl transferase